MSGDNDGFSAWKEMRHLSAIPDPDTLQIIHQETRETVLVNALAYFMHPKSPHGLDCSILKNLLGGLYPEKTGAFLCLATEFPCQINKTKVSRIDLFIEFEYICIAIEAKVNAEVKNPFETYKTHLDLRADGRETKQYLLQKKNKNEINDDLWENITWAKLIGGCNYKPTKTKQGHLESLFKGLKNIDTIPNEIEMGELKPKIDELDTKAKELLKQLETKYNKKYKCRIWHGDENVGREIFEPRIVVDDKKNGFVIDIIVGFRGIQFVVFNRKSYDPELYRRVKTNYGFCYWQDYSDIIELYDRYLIFVEGVKGPRVSSEEINASEMGTVFFANDCYDENQKWIARSVSEVKKIIDVLNK